MKTLTLMVGLPRSGKSTWSKKTGHPVVSHDAIQYVVCGKQLYTIPEFQPMSDTLAQYMIKALFQSGHDNVVYDECNHLKLRRDVWTNFCNDNGYTIYFQYIDTPMKVCQERAKGYKNEHTLVPLIKKMAGELELEGINYKLTVRTDLHI